MFRLLERIRHRQLLGTRGRSRVAIATGLRPQSLETLNRTTIIPSAAVPDVMYTALYMAATRTQIYLRPDQRDRADELAEMLGIPLAEVIRRALDEYLNRTAPDPEEALSETFGSLREIEVPDRREWEDRENG